MISVHQVDNPKENFTILELVNCPISFCSLDNFWLSRLSFIKFHNN